MAGSAKKRSVSLRHGEKSQSQGCVVASSITRSATDVRRLARNDLALSLSADSLQAASPKRKRARVAVSEEGSLSVIYLALARHDNDFMSPLGSLLMSLQRA